MEREGEGWRGMWGREGLVMGKVARLNFAFS